MTSQAGGESPGACDCTWCRNTALRLPAGVVDVVEAAAQAVLHSPAFWELITAAVKKTMAEGKR